MLSERVQRRIQALLDDADAALAERDWQAALESARVALGLDPENQDAKSFVEAAQQGLDARTWA